MSVCNDFFSAARLGLSPALASVAAPGTPDLKVPTARLRGPRARCRPFCSQSVLFLAFSSLQTLHRPRRPQREAQAEAHSHHVHERAAQRAGEGLRRDALPRHLHPGGAGAEDRPHGGARPGTRSRDTTRLGRPGLAVGAGAGGETEGSEPRGLSLSLSRGARGSGRGGLCARGRAWAHAPGYTRIRSCKVFATPAGAAGASGQCPLGRCGRCPHIINICVC